MPSLPPSLIGTDYDRSIQPTPLRGPFAFYASDAGSLVDIDVTPLIRQVQRNGLDDLPVRLILDLSDAWGRVEIDCLHDLPKLRIGIDFNFRKILKPSMIIVKS